MHRFKRVIVLGLAVCTSALPLTFTSKAYAAGITVVDSTAGSLCKTGPYTNGNYAQQFLAGTTATISGINIQVGSASTTYFTNSLVKIYADNSQLPGTLLGTFSPSSISSGIAQYTGSVSVTSGTKFWVFPTYSTGNTTWCYAYPSTDGTPVTYQSGWTNAYNGTIGAMYFNQSPSNGAGWGSTMTSAFLIQLAIVVNGNLSPSTVSLRNVGIANYRLTQVLYADLGVAGTNGAVTFYANGKPIPGCRSIQSVTLSASCNWKPAQLGGVTLAAKIVPSNSTFTPSSSSAISAMVVARNTTR